MEPAWRNVVQEIFKYHFSNLVLLLNKYFLLHSEIQSSLPFCFLTPTWALYLQSPRRFPGILGVSLWNLSWNENREMGSDEHLFPSFEHATRLGSGLKVYEDNPSSLGSSNTQDALLSFCFSHCTEKILEWGGEHWYKLEWVWIFDSLLSWKLQLDDSSCVSPLLHALWAVTPTYFIQTSC